MRRALIILLPAMLAGCGGPDAGSGAATPPPPMTMATPAAAPSPSMVPADQMTIRAELVKVDAAAKSITVRDLAGDTASAEKTLTVDDGAALANLKAGDQVALTCRTSMSVPVTTTSPATTAGTAGATGTTPGTTTTAAPPALDASAMASVSACSGVISVAAADQPAGDPAGGAASPTPGR